MSGTHVGFYLNEPSFYRGTICFLASIWFAVFGAIASLFLGDVAILDGFSFLSRMGVCAAAFALCGAIIGFLKPKITKAVLFDIFLGSGGDI